MITAKEYEQLEKRHRDARSEADKAQGSLENLMSQLEDEFGCKTKKQAQTKLKKLEKASAEAEEAYEDAVAEFEEQWD